MRRTFSSVADLPVQIDDYRLRPMHVDLSPAMTRVTTIVELRGPGPRRQPALGLGEDVTYEPQDHDEWIRSGRELPLRGSFTLASFSANLAGLELFPTGPTREQSRNYRRWALESAALDLALRQSEMSLAEAIARKPSPLHFVVSLNLGSPPEITPIDRLLHSFPDLKFKLDPTSEWDDALIAMLASTGDVEILDFKGQYHGTPVDQPADPVLYQRIVDAFPQAWLEDPCIDSSTESILAPHMERVTWDAPIHSVADIEAQTVLPSMLNMKPSRFGTVERLFDTYDYCAANDISMYSGGQFEIGPGRGQAQYLAAMFHPHFPNDIAPIGYNFADPDADLPESPLSVTPDRLGFRWLDEG